MVPNKSKSEIPRRFTWSMFVTVQRKWIGWMLILCFPACLLPEGKGIFFMIMASLLILISIYDWRYRLIYDRLTALLLLLGLLPLSCGYMGWGEAVMGVVFGSGLLGGLRYLSHGGVGMGDIKLVVSLGVWLGLENMILCLLLASCLGVIYGGVVLGRHRICRQTVLPFGPFLAVGALLAFGAGTIIWEGLGVFLWG